jgi:hypothetical protein
MSGRLFFFITRQAAALNEGLRYKKGACWGQLPLAKASARAVKWHGKCEKRFV